MLNLSVLAMLISMTACQKEEIVKVKPKSNELIGKWEWEISTCDCPQCRCKVLDSKSANRTQTIEIKNNYISYFSKDTLLFELKYVYKSKDSLKIEFSNRIAHLDIINVFKSQISNIY